MASPIHSRSDGVFVIAATPFTDSGAVDLDSIDALTDFYLSFGIDGLTIMGIMGEAQKLSQDESLAVIIGLIDEFCREHLNEEYAGLCRKLAEKLARNRPSPLVGGQSN